jgi:hypothetical protein
MKRDFKGRFKGKAKTLGDIFEASVVGAWNWTEKTLVIFAIIGMVYGYHDIKTYLNKPVEAKEEIAVTPAQQEELRRDKKVQADIVKMAKDIEQDTAFKAETERMVEELKKGRSHQALQQAMFVYKTGYESQLFDLNKILQ